MALVTAPIVYLDDLQIANLLKQGSIIPCERRACIVCGQAVHDRPSSPRAHRCPHGCRLTPLPGVECRVCGTPVAAARTRRARLTCPEHETRGSVAVPDGVYTMRLVDHHFHAANGTGPVTQYAATQKVEASA